MNNTKEVRFDNWCHTCKYRDKEATDIPCNDCLAQPYNIDSSKPIYYKEEEKHGDTDDNTVH